MIAIASLIPHLVGDSLFVLGAPPIVESLFLSLLLLSIFYSTVSCVRIDNFGVAYIVGFPLGEPFVASMKENGGALGEGEKK